MGNVTFDTDEIAARIRQYLNIGKYAIAAASKDADVDYRDGLMSAAAARESALTTYSKVKQGNDVNELSRFSKLNGEAADLITQFWEVLGVVVLKRVSTGETKAVRITPAEPRKAIVHNGKRGRGAGKRMPHDSVVDLVEYFMQATDKKHEVTHREFSMLAEKYDVTNSAVYQRYQTYKAGRYANIVGSIRAKVPRR